MKKLPPFDHWQPYSLSEVRQKLQGLDWILAGGVALKQFVGKAYRTHDDIDILVQRDNQHSISQYIPHKQLFVAAIPGQLIPLDTQKYYDKPIQDIWCLNGGNTAWSLQMMLFDVEDSFWVYKRNPAICLPLSQIYFEKEGVKILNPEIQLLYKSNTIRPKDQLDFEAIMPLLSKKAKLWLREALMICYDNKHLWLPCFNI